MSKYTVQLKLAEDGNAWDVPTIVNLDMSGRSVRQVKSLLKEAGKILEDYVKALEQPDTAGDGDE